MTGMREATEAEFWAAMQGDVHPVPVGKYPYTTYFREGQYRDGRTAGVIDVEGKYWLPARSAEEGGNQ